MSFRENPTEIERSLANSTPVWPGTPSAWKPAGELAEIVKWKLAVHIEDTIGKGTMCYRAKSNLNNKPVAALLTSLSAEGGGPGKFPVKEVKAISHPYLINIVGKHSKLMAE